ncbi:hypothetical protein ABZS86_10595 [Streptomyces sp. NPDC005355]|uniref:hypothetical protein n=1 Tax=Streptomyces sp. NPDC005355 TaxID=3157038 RepID=UPI0033A44F9A
MTGVLFTAGGLALCGLPPFGSGLGKALAEEATGHTAGWLPARYVLVPAVTGGTVLRAALRVFAGAGPRPRDGEDEGPETTGREEPETAGRLWRIPLPMTAVPAVLLAAPLAVGVIPAVASAVGRAGALFADGTGYRRAVLDGRATAAPELAPPHWSAAGILLGPLSTALAVALAALAVRRRPARTGTAALLAPVRRLQSGHIGDYVAWMVAGTALLAALTVPGVR